MDQLTKINEAGIYIRSKLTVMPEVGMILGSGLGSLADLITDPIYIKYEEIPHFPVSTVEGHAGRFVIGHLSGRIVMAMQGRFHYYEGYSMQDVTLPVRVMKVLGITNLLVTNAAGGVNTSFVPGDLMIITDHINMTGDSPLIGKNENVLGPRFPDVSEIYSKKINADIEKIASDQGIQLKKGVYMMNIGPAYETPAEIRFARIIGADAVGMSTVPETIVARHGGMTVTGISCITNMASGILDQPLDHSEVVETAERIKETFTKLILSIVPVLK